MGTVIPESHVTAGHLIGAGFLALAFTGWYYAVEYARKRVAKRIARRKARRRQELREAAVASLDVPPQQWTKTDTWMLQRDLSRRAKTDMETAA